MTHEVKWHLKLTADYFRRTADDLDRIFKAMEGGDFKALRVIRRYYQTIRDYPLQSDPKRAERETSAFICDIIDLFQIESQVKEVQKHGRERNHNNHSDGGVSYRNVRCHGVVCQVHGGQTPRR